MEKRWVYKERNKELSKKLAEELGIHRALANLLTQRNITTFEDAKAFFRPELSQLHDPFLMKDMRLAIKRIEEAIKKNQKILIYGDYDVDGTTAVALVYSFFKKIYSNIEFYIPNRYSEGYGVSYLAIDYAASKEVKLVISLDCGIKANEQINYALSKGIDFIICDHHRPGDILPLAYAILDPKQSGCNYPYKELSGCGVGFKLIQAWSLYKNTSLEEIYCYLDLVVVSIASDIVPIIGENRVLAYYGLKKINKNPNPGLEAILTHCNLLRLKDNENKDYIFAKELSISDLVFMIGPRINAAGRIEHGSKAVELLLTENLELALEISQYINENNNERRNLDSQTTIQAIESVKNDLNFQNKKTTVVYNPDWHKGVVGIVASRLTEAYYRPTIVLTNSNGLISGSARSIKDFDVYEAIDKCGDLLESFGGHKYAAGLSMKPENLQKFIDKFESVVNSTIDEHIMTPEIEIDDEIELTDISPKFFRVLKQFAPFGPENMNPIFSTKNVVDKGFAKIVGEKHIKLTITYPSYDPSQKFTPVEFPAIAFQQSDFFDKIKQKINICYHIEENEWNGSVYLQLNIKDMRETSKS